MDRVTIPAKMKLIIAQLFIYRCNPAIKFLNIKSNFEFKILIIIFLDILNIFALKIIHPSNDIKGGFHEILFNPIWYDL
jgi:hypothetical protein